ncbi:hypothetical protein BGX20_005941, partial [Mortierella sp. AD010]
MVKRKVNGNWDLVLPAKKRNKTEQAFVEYVESLSDLSEVSAKDYAMYAKANVPAVRHKFIISTWEKMNTAKVREVSSMPPTLPNTSGSSSTSLESSSSTLSTDAVTVMNTLYSKNFRNFKGDPWVLSTGTNVDEFLQQYTITHKKESSLHSFVIVNLKPILELLESEDSALFQQSISEYESKNENAHRPDDWKLHEIQKFELSPSQLWILLREGWSGNGVNLISDIDQVTVDTFRR